MPLQPGDRLGPYEVTAQVGVGGMGEVYKATDTNLKRAVAIKVLPASVALDGDRLARFQREAEILAALNHPHIAAIYGLERSGGITGLVMELVEGPTLADRIAQGAIPIDEALPIAKQIAEALEAAHEQGIIHRDLKPANIKVRPDGTVKVLDFGLAKAMEPAGGMSSGTSQAPTITTPAMMTGVGVILGTAAYMSPEQARGKTVDKRADIWAFGAVLFEILTGQRAFGGEDVTETLAAVVKSEPKWDALPGRVSPSLCLFLRRCLHKDPRERIGDIRDVRLALTGAFDVTVSAGAVRLPTWRRLLVPIVALLGGGGMVGAAMWFATQPTPAAVVRTIVSTSDLRISEVDRSLTITPDGAHILYRGQDRLLVRAMDSLEATVLMGTGDTRHVFTSPDGRWVGFFGPGLIRKMLITGGPPVTVSAVDGSGSLGATWGPDDTIVYATNLPTTGLQRVSAGGGKPVVLTTPNRERGESDHVWPEFLPGGEVVLFTIWPETGVQDSAQIAALDLRTNTQTVLIRGGSHAHYVPTGHLVYGAGGVLRAVPFDAARLAVTGTPVPVLDQVATTQMGSLHLAFAPNGTLVYLPGGVVAGAQRSLVWVDRTGREEPLPAPPRAYTYPRISPDGTRVALDIRDQDDDIWTWDLERRTLTRLTFAPGGDEYPVWAPNGRSLFFGSGSTLAQNVFVQPADGTGRPERLTESPSDQDPQTIAPDGRLLVFRESNLSRATDLMLLGLEPSQPARPLMKTMFSELNAEISPDGRWLAYQSDESGRAEIYVRPFPEVEAGRWQVSSEGGATPVWAGASDELYFRSLTGAVMSARVERADLWRNATPTELFNGPYLLAAVNNGRTYDVARDGRFLMIRNVDVNAPPTHLVVVQNWFEELKRLVPTN